jgi:multiple sugar transport system permease protein
MTTTAPAAHRCRPPPRRRRPFNPAAPAPGPCWPSPSPSPCCPSSGCCARHCPPTTRWPRNGQPAAGGLHLGAFKRVFGLQSPAEAVAEGGSGAAIDFWLYLRNSIVFSSITTAGAVFFSAMAAYAFARLRWKGRNAVFSLFLGTMLVPPIFTALPNFLLIKNLDLLNTMLGMVLPYVFMTPFAIFFLRQFFLNMSREVEEAAMLDGAKHLRIFFQIVCPTPQPHRHPCPADLYRPVERVLLAPAGRLPGRRPRAQVGLGVFKSQSPQGAPDWSGLMAATLVSALPVLILFAAFGKKIVNSIGFSGIK